MRLDRKTFQSLGFYLGAVLLVGQLGARTAGIPFNGPFDWIFLGGCFVLVIAPMFGRGLVIELIRAVRREYVGPPPDTSGGDDDGA